MQSGDSGEGEMWIREIAQMPTSNPSLETGGGVNTIVLENDKMSITLSDLDKNVWFSGIYSSLLQHSLFQIPARERKNNNA